ncbi:hypothetical protein EW093_10105 [Thiospirochaeta perfilievii]|uniref:Uncharacterized protein n=1 Tax=Thiospirochaeta perfilievii TaxID=252967 RepID=A0A5C1QEH3_9SPIO|nr:hypothetical protein [Thiospirochaeta perfilievii]QEN05046.1 hypothetical protein EW093_10105 [Thiospirochaeta perfilievii]
MNSLIVKARFKFILYTLQIFVFVITSTTVFRESIPYQLTIFLIFTTYFFLSNRERLLTFLNFTKFLLIAIVLLHTIFFTYKYLVMGREFALEFYIERWKSIVLRIFIIPNLFAFINIIFSKIGFIDIILLTGNSPLSKIFYILMVSGTEVMERLKIHYEYHPLNRTNRGLQKIYHYLAVPLTLFFGIYRGFETKYKILLERERVLEEKI